MHIIYIYILKVTEVDNRLHASKNIVKASFVDLNNYNIRCVASSGLITARAVIIRVYLLGRN